MNNEELILRSLGWIMRNTQVNSEHHRIEELNLLEEINNVLNPPKQKSIAEKTHDALCEDSEVKK